MRVNDRNALGPASVEAGRTADAQKSDRTDTTRAGVADPSSDRVEFSASLSQLAHVVSVDTAQRSSRVQALASAYQAGNYRPNSQGASRGLIAEAASKGI